MTKGRSRITINYIKKIVIACVICVVGIVGTINVNADTKKVDIVVNKTNTIKVKEPSVKVKWTIKNKKIVKIVKIKGKKNNILKIKGIKNGKTKIIAKYKNKKRVFIINVVNKNKKKNTDSEKIINNQDKTQNSETTSSQNTANNKNEETTTNGEAGKGDNQNPVNETKIKLSYVNDKITLKDNLIIKYSLTNGKGVIALDYKTEKLEKYIDGKWELIEKKNEYQNTMYEVNDSEMIRNADLNNYYDISIGQYRLINKVNGQECIVNFNVYENDTKFVGILKNNQINMNDELSFYVYAVGNEDNTYPGSLQPGKLEIYEDNQWKNIELSDDARFPEIIILIENLRPGYFSIPIFQDYVGLHSGHYRYIHTIEGINIPMEFDVL